LRTAALHFETWFFHNQICTWYARRPSIRMVLQHFSRPALRTTSQYLTSSRCSGQLSVRCVNLTHCRTTSFLRGCPSFIVGGFVSPASICIRELLPLRVEFAMEILRLDKADISRLSVAKTNYMYETDGIRRGHGSALMLISPRPEMSAEQKPISILRKRRCRPFQRSFTYADRPLVVQYYHIVP
jgi:hypothetical protein